MSKLKDVLVGFKRIPKVVVFDIDYTLWPFHIDCYGTQPFTPDGRGGARDRHENKMDPFEDVRKIFAELEENSIKIAAASRTDDPPASKALLTALGLHDLFHYRQIYPGQKHTHFKRIKRDSGVKYEDMLFFDDEYRNIRDISELGVTCFYIEDSNGVTWSRLKEGFEQFNSRT